MFLTDARASVYDAVLPIADPAAIAVVGPLADAVLTGWYSGTPRYTVGLASALAERYPTVRVDVVTGADTVTLRLRVLVAYQRLRLAPGEHRTLELEFGLERLAVWDDATRPPDGGVDWLHQGALRVQPGEYRVAAGGSADSLGVETVLTVV